MCLGDCRGKWAGGEEAEYGIASGIFNLFPWLPAIFPTFEGLV